MVFAAPRIVGNVGAELPLSYYTASLIDAFPRANTLRNVETEIIDRYTLKIPPTNQTTSQ
ncbi:hypothetical protein SK128_002715, partial [Halocaridina rubra]